MTIWLCTDCALTVNGYAHLASVHAPRLIGPVFPDHDPETLEGYREDSRTVCDGCGARTPGPRIRYRA